MRRAYFKANNGGEEGELEDVQLIAHHVHVRRGDKEERKIYHLLNRSPYEVN